MNLRAIRLARQLFKNNLDLGARKYHLLNGPSYDRIYGKWDNTNFEGFTELLFNLITGERSFRKFYDRFDSPAGHEGKQPVAWAEGFIPDHITGILTDDSLSDKELIDRVKFHYELCIKKEEEFKKGKQK